MGEDEVGENELDDIEKVEKMIEDAVTELEHAAEQNPDLEDVIGSFREAVEVTKLNVCSEFSLKITAKLQEIEDTGATGDQQIDDKGSVFTFDATINNNVLKELEEAERQAKETAKIINELKERVAVLVKV